MSVQPAPLSVQVTIQFPSPGDHVPREVNAQGVAQNVPEGQRIWLLVNIGRLFWPQTGSLVILPGGEWSMPVLIGAEGDAGKAFNLIAVQADPVAHEAFAQWIRDGELTGEFPGLEEGGNFPTVEFLASVALVRT